MLSLQSIRHAARRWSECVIGGSDLELQEARTILESELPLDAARIMLMALAGGERIISTSSKSDMDAAWEAVDMPEQELPELPEDEEE